MTQALTTRNGSAHVAPWQEDEIKLIKSTVARAANLSDAELAHFARVCEATGLDPLRRQIYAVRYEGNDSPVTFQTAIDGYRLIAQRTGKLAGLHGPFWCGEDGQWRDVWLSTDPPKAARFGVDSRDFRETVWAVALYDEYVATRYDKDSRRRVPNSQWTKRPAHMLGKCAEALALRRAFPEETAGVYTIEEMEREQYDRRPVFVEPEAMLPEPEDYTPEADPVTGEVIDVTPEEEPSAPEPEPQPSIEDDQAQWEALTAAMQANGITSSRMKAVIGAFNVAGLAQWREVTGKTVDQAVQEAIAAGA